MVLFVVRASSHGWAVLFAAWTYDHSSTPCLQPVHLLPLLAAMVVETAPPPTLGSFLDIMSVSEADLDSAQRSVAARSFLSVTQALQSLLHQAKVCCSVKTCIYSLHTVLWGPSLHPFHRFLQPFKLRKKQMCGLRDYSHLRLQLHSILPRIHIQNPCWLNLLC